MAEPRPGLRDIVRAEGISTGPRKNPRNLVAKSAPLVFWEIERPQFVLVQGPKWIRIDEGSGVLRGVPDAAGNADVVVKVTLERSVRRLDEGRLSWGLELVKEVVTEKVGSATQRFRIRVSP